MKQALLTVLRDIHTDRHAFRQATEKLSFLLAGEAGSYLQDRKVMVQTPLAKTEGKVLNTKLAVIPILRAGLAMLPAFIRFYPEASIGFFGMRRDEKTMRPELYYENLPELTSGHNVILIDPMIATGGSGALALRKIIEKGVPKEQIIYVGIVASPEGIKRVKELAPGIHLIVAQEDKELNSKAFIVPGIGDFGDRYFGTEPK